MSTPGLRLVVCGHANLDLQMTLQELPRAGLSSPVLDRRIVWGGTGANVARHASGLGVPVRLWARVGYDFPTAWSAAMEADGVDLQFLERDPQARTPTCYVMTDLIDRQAYAMDQGAMATMAAHPPPPAILDGLGPGDWLHLGTGDPAAYRSLAHQARQRGLSITADPGQELRFLYDAKAFETLLQTSDLAFLNDAEMQIALDLLGYGDPVQLLDHIDCIVATHGAKGASLYRSRKKAQHVPARSVPRVVDSTGAGDALRAGWYAALRSGKDFETALAWGQAAGAAKVQMAGPQPRALQTADLGL